MSWVRALALCGPLAGCSLVLAGDLDDARDPVHVTSTDAAVVEASNNDVATPDAAIGYAATVLADAPIAYWRLEEASGTTFHSEVGAHDLTLTDTKDVTYGVPGVGGGHTLHLTGAMRFEVSGVLTTAGSNDFTLEAWVKREFTDARYAIVFEKNAILDNGVRDGMVLWVNPTREVDSAFEIYDHNTNTGAAIGGPVALGGFTHIALTRTSGQCRLYVGGAATGDTPANLVIPDSSPIIAWGDSFQGSLDELAVYDHALTSERVIAHAAAGR